MKVLYLSCHAILEYDELKMFEELGLDYFSLGSYINPQLPVDPIRPALTKVVDQDLLSKAPYRESMPKEFIDNFDVIIIMDGSPSLGWIAANWENMKHKRVILRMIGQSTPEKEIALKMYRGMGLEIVRYSPREQQLKEYAGHDAIIRFGKDETELTGWNGNDKSVINFTQNLAARGEHCHYDTTTSVIRQLNGKIYGPKNEGLGDLSGGFLTYENMLQKYRDSRVYFYNGTQPACYTLTFIEAFIMGIPMVCIGPLHQKITKEVCGDVYEIPDIISSHLSGFVSDDISQLVDYCKILLANEGLAKSISTSARGMGIKLFGKENIKRQWAAFLHI